MGVVFSNPPCLKNYLILLIYVINSIIHQNNYVTRDTYC